MTCPVSQHHAASRTTATTSSPAPAGQAGSAGADGDVDTSGSAVVERFERVSGSIFLRLFGMGLYDQTMLPQVSAALEDTGRIRSEPWARAIRTTSSDQMVFLGDDADRAAESARLRSLHREVKGVGPDGERYSALNPDNWNWILYSSFFVQRTAFLAVTGEQLSAADNQAIWDHFRAKTADLELPGRSRLLESYDELVSYYDRVVHEKLTTTATLEAATSAIRQAPRPDFLPAAADPLWRLGAPALRHVITVLGCGGMHPGVRELMPFTWTDRHDLEYRAMTKGLQLAYRWLPTAVTDTPLARNRRRYAKLIAKSRGRGLISFAPGNTDTAATRG